MGFISTVVSIGLLGLGLWVAWQSVGCHHDGFPLMERGDEGVTTVWRCPECLTVTGTTTLTLPAAIHESLAEQRVALAAEAKAKSVVVAEKRVRLFALRRRFRTARTRSVAVRRVA